jgi:hypothetical protein
MLAPIPELHWLWEHPCLLVLCGSLLGLLGCGGEEGGRTMPPTARRGMRAELEARAVALTDELRIAVTLANTGDVPFTVDRRLVFGLRVLSPDLGLPAEEWEHIKALERPDRATVRSRFVEVRPGQSVTRDIDLRGGFEVFWHASATYTDGSEGMLTHEYLVRLPEGPRPSSLIVDYSPSLVDSGAFRTYTGLGRAILEPFPGRVTDIVSF